MSESRGACENAVSPQNVRFSGSGAKPGNCISHHCPGTTSRALLSAILLYCLLRLLDGMERSLKFLVLPDLQPPFEKVPPLTFPPGVVVVQAESDSEMQNQTCIRSE